jgi:uncharacterized protein (DUF433 family)
MDLGNLRRNQARNLKMDKTIAIIDRGRGPQLATSRITVQDLVPYIQQNFSHEQILEIMPVLTVEEIEVVERYILDNYVSVMEQDRRIRERAAARRKPPQVEEADRQERLERLEKARQLIRQGKQVRNGDRTAC